MLAANAAAKGRSPQELAQDEDYWFEIQQGFTVDRSLVNLNNGGVSPAPKVVQDALRRYVDFSNQAPVYTMWDMLEPQIETEVPVTKAALVIGGGVAGIQAALDLADGGHQVYLVEKEA